MKCKSCGYNVFRFVDFFNEFLECDRCHATYSLKEIIEEVSKEVIDRGKRNMVLV
jgi:hypothetical protein